MKSLTPVWFSLLSIALGCGGGDDTRLDTTSATPGQGGQVGGAGAGGAGAGTVAGSGGAPAAGSGGVTQGGAGSVATGGTQAAGQAGMGAAGAPPACTVPALVQGPVLIDSVSDTRLEGAPVLLFQSSTGTAATLLYHWTSWPGGTVTGIRTLPLSAPFGTWPDGPLGPTFETQPLMTERPMAAAMGVGGTSSVAYVGWKSSGGRQLQLARAVAPSGGELDGLPIAEVLPSEGTVNPLVVASPVAAEWIVGYDMVSPGGHFSQIARVFGQGSVSASSVGCSTGSLLVDVFGGSQPSLARVVASTGKECCSCSSGQAPGKPNQLVTLQVGGAPEIPKALLAAGAPIVHLRTLPRPGGAWLVVGRESATGAGAVDVEVRTLQSTGEVSEPTSSFSVAAGTTLTTAPYQGGFVVGWLEAVSESASAVNVRLFSNAGAPQVDSSFSVPFARGTGPFALLASPSGGAMIVAWSHPSAVPMEQEKLHVARLAWGCEK